MGETASYGVKSFQTSNARQNADRKDSQQYEKRSSVTGTIISWLSAETKANLRCRIHFYSYNVASESQLGWFHQQTSDWADYQVTDRARKKRQKASGFRICEHGHFEIWNSPSKSLGLKRDGHLYEANGFYCVWCPCHKFEGHDPIPLPNIGSRAV